MKRNTTTFGTYPKIYAYIVVSSVCIVVEELAYIYALHTHTILCNNNNKYPSIQDHDDDDDDDP